MKGKQYHKKHEMKSKTLRGEKRRRKKNRDLDKKLIILSEKWEKIREARREKLLWKTVADEKWKKR